MNNLIQFDFKDKTVRVITDINGEIMFVAKDVCDILGYSNSRKAVKDHCKNAINLNSNITMSNQQLRVNEIKELQRTKSV
jgi:prophage antirepressor-like protein